MLPTIRGRREGVCDLVYIFYVYLLRSYFITSGELATWHSAEKDDQEKV